MNHRLTALLIVLYCLTVPRAALADIASRDPRDPLPAMIQRVDVFLHRAEVEGVTRDARSLGYPAEEIRLSVVSQLLAYCELHRVYPSAAHFQDVVERADFLVRNFDRVTSRTAADGMLSYALLSAYEITGDGRHLAPAVTIVRRCLELRGFGLKLNWGLMAALALAKYHRLTGDPAALAKAQEIVRGVARSQNADGSLPHVCPGSKDVHYTAWMSMELIQLHRLLGDPLLSRMLIGTYSFMLGRVGADGVVRYEDTSAQGHSTYYYAPGNGCRGDYDTREWVNELGYDALLFDRFSDTRYQSIMERLLRLEDGGSFPDKWGDMPSLDDPIYSWASAPRSVIRTSLVFWSLASLYADREKRGPARYLDTGLATVLPGVSEDAADLVSVMEALDGGYPFSPDGVFQGEAVPDTVPGSPVTVVGGAAPPAGATAADAFHPAPASPALPGPAGLRLAVAVTGSRRGSVTIRFSLPEDGHVALRLYDVMGRSVRDLWRGPAERGEHQVAWDGRDGSGTPARSGLYFVRIECGTSEAGARLTWMR
jgi:hypothetical protein